MAELSLDFKNEIINEIINEKRRYVMTENEDGTASFTDVTSYSQTGTKYGAEEVIEEREAINQNTNVIGGDAYDSSKSYAAGDYFIYNNQLCKALTAISAGTSLSEGTNYEVTSLENEIAGLNGKILIAYVEYKESNKNEALDKINNPLSNFNINETKIGYPYTIIFNDAVGDSPLYGGVSMIIGYEYYSEDYGAQLVLKYDGNIRFRNKNVTWGEWKRLSFA